MFNAIRQRTVAGLFKVIRLLEEKERSRRLERDRERALRLHWRASA